MQHMLDYTIDNYADQELSLLILYTSYNYVHFLLVEAVSVIGERFPSYRRFGYGQARLMYYRESGSSGTPPTKFCRNATKTKLQLI